MAEQTGIAWTRSTFNPWIGCTKIGPGCDACYAEALDKRMRYGGATHWGDDKPRFRTSLSNWKKPIQWNYEAGIERASGANAVRRWAWHTPGFWPVFCASLADVFDNQVPDAWRHDLWSLIEATPNLSWLIVTKRIGNVERMVPARWIVDGFPKHVRLLATICNQGEAGRDIPKLLMLPVKNGISYEPALGPVHWPPFLRLGVQWIIFGGESNQGAHKARGFDIAWAEEGVAQCREAGVPAFVKQMGSNAYRISSKTGEPIHYRYDDRAGADPAGWAPHLNVQEFPAWK